MKLKIFEIYMNKKKCNFINKIDFIYIIMNIFLNDHLKK
jgi:hypothetical protein